MAGGELAAAFKALAEDAIQAGRKIAESVARFTEKTAANEEANLARTLDAEAQNTQKMAAISEDDAAATPASGAVDGLPRAVDPVGGDDPQAGQPAMGNSSTETGGTDPVDVVSGQLLVSVLDLALPGVLALVLRRAYASGYRDGALFGPGWSSTLDQRLVVDADGARFLGDDAQTLQYESLPSLGLPVYPAHGARWPLVFDRTRGEYHVSDPLAGLTWHFPAEGDALEKPLWSVTDRNGNEITLMRDAAGIVTQIAHCGGYRVAVDAVHTVAGARVAQLRLLDGLDEGQGTRLVSYSYDAAGRLAGTTDSSGVPYLYEWSDEDRIVGWVDRNGHHYRYEYDEVGRVVRTGGDGGYLAANLAYDPDRRVTMVTDSLGHSTEYHYDRFQHITKTVGPAGGTVLTEHDRYGRLLSRTDQIDRTTTIERDYNGSPVRIERPDGNELRLQYNVLSQPTRVSGPAGTFWQYTYDQAGNLLTVTDPIGATSTFVYGDLGVLIAATDALGCSTGFQSNPVGLPLVAIDPLGAVTWVERDSFGRVTALTDPLGAVTRTGWSIEGRPVWRQEPDGTMRRWTYDAAGNPLEHTDAVSGVTAFEYGPLNRVVARIDPTGVRHTFSYDTELRLITVTGPTGLTWDYTLDEVGNVAEENDFNGRTLSYRHDAAGQLVARTNGLGQTTTYVRDQLGHVVERHSGGAVYRYAYDSAGALLRAAGPDTELAYVRDPLGRPVSETTDGRTLTREYDPLGNTIRRTTPSGAESVWTFDEVSLPRTLITAAGELGFAHDAAGREIRRALGANATLTQAFDAAGRLAEQTVAVRQSTIQQRGYAYRADGVPVEIRDQIRGTRSLAINAAGRVIAVTAVDWSENYAYDPLGNLAHAEHPAADQDDIDTLGGREYTGTLIRRAGRTAYEHDAHGRLVSRTRRTLSGQARRWTYTWDADDRLVRATLPDGTVWSYQYDPVGRRTAKLCSANDGTVIVQIRFTWDGTRLAEQEYRSRDGRVTVLTWDWEPGTQRAVAQSRHSRPEGAPQHQIDTEFWAIVTDLAGTPQELVTSDGRVAWHRTANLWGGSVAVTGAEISCPLRFPGQYHDDETGLDYNYHRYYDPENARYATADPLGLAPQPNHHTYISNPFTWQDPSGLAGEDISWNWKSVKTFGHTFLRHGVGVKNTRNLAGRAATEGTPQGQWLDNDKAAEFLKDQYDPAKTERWEVDLPPGLGQIVNADGTTVPAYRARLVPNNDGVYRSAFPIPGASTCPST